MMTPAGIAKLFLKINIAIACITLGANALLIYPYYLHLTQLANNLAMDVSSKNYATAHDVNLYFKPLTEDKKTLYSVRTYIPGSETFNGATTMSVGERNKDKIFENFNSGGIYVYTPPLSSNSIGGTDYNINNVINVSVKSCTNKDLILESATTTFNPLVNNSDMIKGMDGTTFGGTMVQRGTAFQVEVNTRYVLSGFAMGANINMVIPVKVQSVGVTTQS